MKITDKLVNRFGADKLLHFCLAGWAVAASSLYGVIPMMIVTIILVALSMAKEKKWDKNADVHDMFAAFLGILVAWIWYIIFITVSGS